MPPGPPGYIADPNYEREFSRAKELLFANPKRWRIIYHYDGDGIASASSAFRALRRLGYAVQATPLLGVEESRLAELMRATKGPVMILDTGASFLKTIAEHPSPVIVLDHHQYPGAPHPPELPSRVAFVDPLDWGVDGMSALCAATLTWLFTILVDPVNWDNAAFGISGAIADRQHVGGFQGLNQTLVNEALQRSLVVRRPGPALSGRTVGEALSESIDPYLAGLSGRPEQVAQFARELGLDPGRSLESLTPEEREKLVQELSHLLSSRNVRPEFVAMLKRPDWFLPSWGVSAEELSELQNATGREGIPSAGVAMALGDTGSWEKARAARRQWKEGILRGLRRVEEGEVNATPTLHWFLSPEVTLAGTQAGLAMAYLLDPEKPVLAFSEVQGRLKVSARGTPWLVDRGLDLDEAVRAAASEVGGEGGGHKVASGATIPAAGRDRFVQSIDRAVARQLQAKVGAAA